MSMTMISYAQNGEDVLLARVFAGQKAGFYIDVGANDPVWCSVTKHFYDRGWRGINIEPGGIFQKLARRRLRDINLHCGLSNRQGHLHLYEFPSKPGLSTCSREVAQEHSRQQSANYVERVVPIRTLAQVCAEHVRGTIDFLKIDVEGHEREVLEGGDWRKFRPRVVLLEAAGVGTDSPSHAAWEPLLLKADYHYATFDGLNRYYVRGEEEPLKARLSFPLNVMDNYVAWHHIHRYEGLGGVALGVARGVQCIASSLQRALGKRRVESGERSTAN